MEGPLTQVPTADSLITPPDPTLDCGIVTAWWHYQVKGTRAHHGSRPTTPDLSSLVKVLFMPAES